jgi:SMI1-KNR4 cell-wall
MPSISDTEWASVEQALGRSLPEGFRDYWEEIGGLELFGGNVNIHPHSSEDDDELTLANASDRLRSWEWPVPDEMVIFASNGQDGSFGVWLPRDGDARPIVVEIGEIFEDACLAVVGDDLESFVRAWGAYYLALIGYPDEMKAEFPEFDLPEELALTDDGSEDEFFAILRWANPGLPDPRPDPYERGLTAAQVDEIARSEAR